MEFSRDTINYKIDTMYANVTLHHVFTQLKFLYELSVPLALQVLFSSFVI